MSASHSPSSAVRCSIASFGRLLAPPRCNAPTSGLLALPPDLWQVHGSRPQRRRGSPGRAPRPAAQVATNGRELSGGTGRSGPRRCRGSAPPGSASRSAWRPAASSAAPAPDPGPPGRADRPAARRTARAGGSARTAPIRPRPARPRRARPRRSQRSAPGRRPTGASSSSTPGRSGRGRSRSASPRAVPQRSAAGRSADTDRRVCSPAARTARAPRSNSAA